MMASDIFAIFLFLSNFHFERKSPNQNFFHFVNWFKWLFQLKIFILLFIRKDIKRLYFSTLCFLIVCMDCPWLFYYYCLQKWKLLQYIERETKFGANAPKIYENDNWNEKVGHKHIQIQRFCKLDLKANV